MRESFSNWDQFENDYRNIVNPFLSKNISDLREHVLGLWEERECSEFRVGSYQTKVGMSAVFVFRIEVNDDGVLCVSYLHYDLYDS